MLITFLLHSVSLKVRAQPTRYNSIKLIKQLQNTAVRAFIVFVSLQSATKPIRRSKCAVILRILFFYVIGIGHEITKETSAVTMHIWRSWIVAPAAVELKGKRSIKRVNQLTSAERMFERA